MPRAAKLSCLWLDYGGWCRPQHFFEERSWDPTTQAEKWLLLCIIIIKAGFVLLVASRGKLHPTFPSSVIPQVLVKYCFSQYALVNFKAYLSAISLHSTSHNSISHIIERKCKQVCEELKISTLVRPKMKTLHTVKQHDGLLNLCLTEDKLQKQSLSKVKRTQILRDPIQIWIA